MEVLSMDDEVVLLKTVNQEEARLLIPLLEDNNIMVLKKHRETGGLMEIYGNNTLYGIDLFVSRDKLKEAKELAALIVQDEEDIK